MPGALTRAQLRLLVLLSVATFFEGYDFLALSQILVNLSVDLDLSKADEGYLVAFINAGTVVAYILVRKGDVWGRRRVFTITIAGYTVFTFLTAFAWNVYAFAGFQFIARVFLIAEWATAMVYAAEEFPAERRGMVIGLISAFASLGSIVCAGVTPLLLRLDVTNPMTGEPFGWRMVYVVGIVPLILLAYARRNLQETRRFADHAALASAGAPRTSLLAIWRTPYRRRVIQLAAIWALTYVCTHNAVTFFKDYAVRERGWSDGDVGAAITIAALVSMPLVFCVGPLLDRLGRRRGAAIVFALAIIGVVATYTFEPRWAITAAMTLSIFGASAVLPVLNAFTTELFPTAYRADAFAWTNNLLGRIGYVLSPLAIGTFAEAHSWGPVLRATAVGPALALVLILLLLPETRHQELEQTSALGR
jgi:MFS transporter, putative metabolite:H+ symporter